MKIGITGARGFLGQAITAEAKARGWSVVAFSRSADKPVEGTEEVRSLQDRESISVAGLDVVINLAGEPIPGLWTKEKKRRIRESRIHLTADLVEAMKRISRSRRPSVFLSASAIGYYGSRGDEWLDEESDVGFGFLSEVCRDWEAEAGAATKLGVRVVIPRIGLVLGDRGLLKKLRPIFRMGLGGRLGSGHQWMSWIHVKDLAKIFADAVENTGIHGRVNCVSPYPVTNREFTTAYAKALGRPAIFPVPSFVLKRLPGGMESLFLASQRVDPVVMKAFDHEWKYSRLEDAMGDIEGG
jgi:uncharacterized protein (TIGR01777 family)